MAITKHGLRNSCFYHNIPQYFGNKDLVVSVCELSLTSILKMGSKDQILMFDALSEMIFAKPPFPESYP